VPKEKGTASTRFRLPKRSSLSGRFSSKMLTRSQSQQYSPSFWSCSKLNKDTCWYLSPHQELKKISNSEADRAAGKGERANSDHVQECACGSDWEVSDF
jgi:hypothetical protein